MNHYTVDLTPDAEEVVSVEVSPTATSVTLVDTVEDADFIIYDEAEARVVINALKEAFELDDV
tara:strand:+ start:61 stop:249 length:189 start_codon:yes stop_codon:yes gene_type:complete